MLIEKILFLDHFDEFNPNSSKEMGDFRHKCLRLIFQGESGSYSPTDKEVLKLIEKWTAVNDWNRLNDMKGRTRCPACRGRIVKEFEVEHCARCDWVREDE